MRGFAIPSILFLVFLTALATAASVAQPPPGVTTTMTFVDPAAPENQANVGQLKSTFQATAGAGGTWNVTVTFKPHALSHGIFVVSPTGLPYWQWMTVHQTASTTVAVTPGQPVQILAAGLTGTNGLPLVVSCTLTAGTDGVVTVQALSLAGSLPPGGQQ